VNIEGQHLDFMKELNCIYGMAWHETEDILFVAGSITDDTCGYYGLEGANYLSYWLIDAERQTVISSVNVRGNVQVYWFADHLLFADWSFPYEPEYPGRIYIVKMYYDGRIEISPSTRDDFYGSLEESEIITRYPDYTQDTEEATFYVQNGEMRPLPEFSFTPPINSSSAVGPVASLWDETREWLLIGYERCRTDCSFVVGRVSVYNPTTGQYREISSCGNNRVCVGWLPTHVPLAEFPAGHLDSVLTAPLQYIREGRKFEEYYLRSHILRCSDEAVYPRLLQDVENHDTGVLEFVLPDAGPCLFFEGELYEPVVSFALSPDRRFYAMTQNYDGQRQDYGYTAIYDAHTGERVEILNFVGFYLEFSPDGSRLYTYGRYADAVWDVEAITARRKSQP
jgi:WD40 repeat protein